MYAKNLLDWAQGQEVVNLIKHFTILIYDSRVVLTIQITHITILG